MKHFSVNTSLIVRAFLYKPVKYSEKVYDLNLGNFSKTGTSDEE